MSHIRNLIDRLNGKAPKGAARSPKWQSVRDAFLRGRVCSVCGSKTKLVAHHIIPFHIAPDMELDSDNLIPLCESGQYGLNCHLFLGHIGKWRDWNTVVEADVAYWAVRLDLW